MYDVYIERPRDASPIAVATLAQGIAAQFRVPTEAIAQRLSAGRFRVKSGADRATAQRIAQSLEGLGAVCSVVDAATGQPLARAATPPPAAAPAPAATPAPAAAPAAAPPSDDYQSGLAAAFGRADSKQDIGVLGSVDDSASFSLATIDGDEGAAAPAEPAAFAPADGGAADADLFAPPEDNEKLEVALAPVTAPPAAAPPPPAAADDGFLTLQPEGGGDDAFAIPPTRLTTAVPDASPVSRARRALASNLGMRIAVGAVLAVLLGFIPAHIVGAIRESSAYDTPRQNIEQADKAYAATDVATSDDLAEADAHLNKVRADQTAILRGRRTSIAITGGVVWLLFAGGLGWLWLKKIDWERWAD